MTDGDPTGIDPTDADVTGAGADADLSAVIDAWPNLPDAVRAGIAAMVRAATPGGAR